AFGAGADGTSWSEGVAMLVVERLSTARAKGHLVLAVLRGSAINQDGAGTGLTVPNGAAQQRVIRSALSDAGLRPCDVDAVEAHGTGTAVGDPVEAAALQATYGCERGDREPLWLGSVKSNIGHTQAAAGLVGVVKMVEALQRGVLPRTRHAEPATPHVDWSAGGVELLTGHRQWSDAGLPRRCAVSSFGLSGTNAHVILEQAPTSAEVVARDVRHDQQVPLLLSARSQQALRAQAGSLLSRVDAEAALVPVDIGFSLATGRSLFGQRAVVVGTRREELVGGLRALADGELFAGVVEGVADVDGKTVFVFPGQGSQWVGMGARLLAESPVFAERFRECADALSPFVDWSLLDVLGQVEGAPSLERVDVVQPASFAVMVSLAALWRSCGVVPDAVLGHSQGEIAAACVAGALSLEDAARVVALRSQVIARGLAGRGAMMSIELPVADVRARIGDRGLSVAAVNGPRGVVVSGGPAELDEFFDELTADEVRVRRIAVDYASHSVQVEGLHQELLEVLAPIVPRASRVSLFSTVTGHWLDTSEMDADYWYRSLRQTVEFAPAVASLLDEQFRVFVEVSSHPVLTMAIEDAVDEVGVNAVVAGSLLRDKGGLDRFLASLAELHVRGVNVDWSGCFEGGCRVDLPTYPFQRSRFWLDAPVARATSDDLDHPILHRCVEAAGSEEVLLTGSVSRQDHEWLRNHQIMDVGLVSGTALLDLAIRAADEVGCNRVAGLVLEAPLLLPENEVVQLQVAVGDIDDSGARTITVHSRCEGAEVRTWTRHAIGGLDNGVLDAGVLDTGARSPELDAQWPPGGATPVELDGCYDRLEACGYQFDPTARGLVAVWRRGPEIFAEVRQSKLDSTQAWSFALHPAVLDAALLASTFGIIAADQVMLPVSWTDVVLHGCYGSILRVRVTPTGSDSMVLLATDPAGNRVSSVGSLVLSPVSADLWRELVRVETCRSVASTAIGDSAPPFREVRDLSEEDGDQPEQGGDRVLVDRISGLSEQDRDRVLVDLVRTEVAAVLGHGAEAAVDADRSFKELGLDSLTSGALRNRLNSVTGLGFARTVVFDHPTPRALAAHVLTELVGLPTPRPVDVAAVAVDQDPIVIVGMSCRLPGGVRSPEDLWDLVST
ncbi:MAG: hypothetical protein QOE58_770, partial [Actinomycetota bacterium]|nr:hypothetical protein [Actinomycetota bacterium]